MDQGDQEPIRAAKRLATRLKLNRPLAFIDLETTGLDVLTCRIVEIAVCRISPDGSFESRLQRVNPQIPIPQDATSVHGISDDDVRHLPAFGHFALALNALLTNCDLAGFGILRFDIPVLEAEFRRASVPFFLDDRAIIDAMSIFFIREPRNLDAALRFYCAKELKDAHNAMADAIASLEVLAGQFEHYDDLPTDLSDLHRMALRNGPEAIWIDEDGILAWVSSEPSMNFGKHRGLSLSEVAARDPTYLDWMLEGDFSTTVKEFLIREKAKVSRKAR